MLGLKEKMQRTIKPYIPTPILRLSYEVYRLSLHTGRDLPTAILIETNTLCTRSCHYCPRPTKKKITLKTETFHSIIDQIKEWGFRGRISPHSYNEPLTDSRIFDLISYTHKKLPQSKIILFTNGDLLTAKKVNRLIDVGVSEIRVSLHEPISAKSKNRLIELGKQYDLIKLKDMTDANRELPLINRGGLLSFKRIEHLPFCSLINMMVIRADGNIVLCCNDVNEHHILGNVEEEDLESVWNKPKFRELRHDIRRGRYALPICKRCGYERV